jgi:hypothetical protein
MDNIHYDIHIYIFFKFWMTVERKYPQINDEVHERCEKITKNILEINNESKNGPSL